jgi:hypothetical protein
MEDMNGARADRPSIERALELSLKGIVSQHAQREVGRSRGTSRPLHQLGEMEEEDGLHVIFFRFGLRLNASGNSRDEK